MDFIYLTKLNQRRVKFVTRSPSLGPWLLSADVTVQSSTGQPTGPRLAGHRGQKQFSGWFDSYKGIRGIKGVFCKAVKPSYDE